MNKFYDGYFNLKDIKLITNIINALKKYRHMYHKEYTHHMDHKEYLRKAEARAAEYQRELNKLKEENNALNVLLKNLELRLGK